MSESAILVENVPAFEYPDAPWCAPEAGFFAAAQLVLGERMVAAGIDDGYLLGHIVALAERIRRAETHGDHAMSLRARRTRLVRQLADAALVDDAPLPGAEAAFRRAQLARKIAYRT